MTSLWTLEDLAKFAKAIEVDGETYTFAMWITAFNKLVIGYRHATKPTVKLISAVVDDVIDTYTETYEDSTLGNNKLVTCTIYTVSSPTQAANVIYQHTLQYQ